MLNFQLDELAPSAEKYYEPSSEEMIQYIFFTKGISLIEFSELPVPYIMSIINAHMYSVKEQEKQLEKQRKK